MTALHKATALFVLLSSTACLADDDATVIRKRLETANPQFKARRISPTPIPGLYEVFAGGAIYYVDKTGQYVLADARLVEVDSKRNLTSERLAELNTIRFEDLPLQHAISIKKGNGAYRFAVFSDPDCPYCKTLETTLEQMKLSDYTAYVFMFPLEQIHQQARGKAESIWCAQDRVGSWLGWMTQGALPEKKSCDNPVDQVIKLADEIGVHATPTIFLQSGRRADTPQELVNAIRGK
jgi:thiol:disulfide interchange protein DsbC